MAARDSATPWRVDRAHLDAARAVVALHARRTPLVRAPALGPEVWLKLETEQDTGSFKLRGALAAIAALDEPARGAITASAGNHGYGMARAGARLGAPIVVCVSRHAPAVKRAGIAAAGATLDLVDARGYDDVEAYAREQSSLRKIPFVSPFDAPEVAAGNGGTIGLEVLEDLPSVRTIVAPVGGGGLIAGLAAARRFEGARFGLVGVQSDACPAMVESLALGRALLRYEGRPTLAEGLEGGVSESTFVAVRDEVSRMETVSEAEIAEAMRFAEDALGLVIEGSAAVGLAWVRARATESDGPLVVVITGGNVDR